VADTGEVSTPTLDATSVEKVGTFHETVTRFGGIEADDLVHDQGIETLAAAVDDDLIISTTSTTTTIIEEIIIGVAVAIVTGTGHDHVTDPGVTGQGHVDAEIAGTHDQGHVTGGQGHATDAPDRVHVTGPDPGHVIVGHAPGREIVQGHDRPGSHQNAGHRRSRRGLKILMERVLLAPRGQLARVETKHLLAGKRIPTVLVTQEVRRERKSTVVVVTVMTT